MSMGTVSITLEAIDKASAELKKVMESLSRLKASAAGTAQAGKDLQKSLQAVGSSSMALATSAFALYMAFDRVEERVLTYQRSLVALHTAQIQLAKAQERYQVAVERYGAGSAQASIAAEQLAKAQEALSVAQMRTQKFQQDINQEIMKTALVAIPASITAIKSLKDLVGGLKGAFSGLTGTAAALGSGLVLLGKYAILAAAAFTIGYKAAEWWDKVGSKIQMTESEMLAAVTDASMGITRATEETKATTAELGEASVDAAGDILRIYYSTKATETAVAALEARYKSGEMGMRDFVQGLLDLGVAQDEIMGKLQKLGDVSAQTIQEKLVTKAQGLIQEFQECSTGKFAQIGKAGPEQMQALVENTNQLLRQGLVGQAQKNIQAFADCAAGKQYRLAYDIAQTTASMTDRVNREYQAMVNWAKTLSGEQRTVALQNAEAWKNEQLAAIQKLRELQATALTQMGADIVTSAQQSTAAVSELNAMIEAIPPQTTPTVNVVVTGKEELTSLQAQLNALSAGVTVPVNVSVGGGGWGGGIFPYGAYYMQEGGIVRRPTLAVLGERGPEAVVPLDRGGGALTQNIHNVFYVSTSNQVEFDRFLDEFERRMVAAWRKAREYA